MDTKKIAIIAGVSALALFAAFTAGRYSKPAKVVEVEVIKEKVVEKVVTQEVEVVKWKTKTVYRDVWDKKKVCTEKFDSVTGKLIERVCSTDSSGSSTGGTDADSSSTTTNTVYVDRVVEKEVVKEKLVEAQLPRWRVGGSMGAQWDEPINLALGDLTYEVHGEVRLVGGVWIGATVVPQLKFAGLSLSLQF